MEEYAFREVLSCRGFKRTGIQDVAFLLEDMGMRMNNFILPRIPDEHGFTMRMSIFLAHGWIKHGFTMRMCLFILPQMAQMNTDLPCGCVCF